MNKNAKKIISLLLEGLITMVTALYFNNKTVYAAEDVVPGIWCQDSTGWWFEADGSYLKGWNQIDGRWYYFYNDGYMAHDTTIEGYYVNSDGEWVDNSVVSYEEFCDEVNREMVHLINEYRHENNKITFKEMDDLKASAKAKSKHMADYNYFSHYYNGQDSSELFNSRLWGENLAYKTFNEAYTKPNARNLAKRFFDGWKASPEHNDNMLSPYYNQFGFGIEKAVYNGQNVFFATQMFSFGLDSRIISFN